MPFELCFSTMQSNMTVSPQARIQKMLAFWLFSCAVMVMLMVLLGGITRLTGSGLSIVEWNPVAGVIFPFTNNAWQIEFAKYQGSPEYLQINQGMSLADFKYIFMLEYIHRLMGRLTGLVLLLPLIYFLAKKYIESDLAYKLLAVFALGAAEGLLGWYMVSSGLKLVPEVSQYRLALHLIFACLIFSCLVWLACNCWRRASIYANTNQCCYPLNFYRHAIFNVILIFLQITMGGFVAGLKAGLVYNSFPLMDGQILPSGLLMLKPLWRNLFENVTTVQFIHRLLAYVALVSMTYFVFKNRSLNLNKNLKWLLQLLLYCFICQFLLGIFTLIYNVPIVLASMHQMGAILLLAVTIVISNCLHHSFLKR